MEERLVKTPEDVLVVLNQIKAQAPVEGDLLSALATALKSTREKILKGITLLDWNAWFLRTGFISYGLLQNLNFDESGFVKLLLDKHRMYGVGPLLNWKQLGIVMRLDSKVARILNIVAHNVEVAAGDESLLDNLKDCLGYCILGYLLCQRGVIESD